VPEPQASTETPARRPTGPFDPATFRAHDETPVQIRWQPGSVVQLDFGTGSIVEKIPPIIVTGIVTAVGVSWFRGLQEAKGRWLWAVLAGVAAILLRTVIEKSRLAPRQVRFDWSTRSASFTQSGAGPSVPFERVGELVLIGHLLQLGGTKASPDSTTHYWCELVASEGTNRHVVAVGKYFDDSDAAYQMVAPMAAELATALSVPWRFEDFAGPLSAILG